ncbi:MAG TPA: hypothetical protein EYG11_23340 [Candidatus Latescibacteria bacterium]|nr:hypothetical protein [Candidatus Handelsmanbacteria bacterium]HIL11632.1 hypothetical protein [Candidatus Latescibacterota bacterium]
MLPARNRPPFLYALTTILLLVSCSPCVAAEALKERSAMQNKFPEFSWDYIPRYMHVWKRASYTDEELEFLADFPLITFEKAQGTAEGSVQEGTLKAARAVKERNAKAKILYYKNIVIDWTGSAASQELETIEGGYLQSEDATYPVVNQNSKCKFFDISLPEVQEWWIDDATQMLDDPSIDGIFVDANIKVLVESYFLNLKKVEKEKAEKIREGYDKLLTEINNNLRPENIIIANIIRARLENGGLDYLDYFDGSYLEGFEHNVGGISRPDYMAKGIACAQEAARQGKIVTFCIGLGEALDKDSSGIGLDEARKGVESLAAVDDRLNYVAAMFLVIAEQYSYFLPYDGTWGVDGKHVNRTWMHTFPVFRKRLGPPKGPATKIGFIYTREFEHCSVWLDIETEKGQLTWK